MRAVLKISDRSTGKQNNFNLIRIVAAAGVLVSHAYPIALGPAASQPLEIWLEGTSLGLVSVMIFFAISGFFITRSFDNSRDWRRFLLARILRLFPALIVALTLTVVVSGYFLTTSDPVRFWVASVEFVFRNATLFKIQYFLPGVFEGVPYGPTINGSLWTLNYELLCYSGVLFAGISGMLFCRGLYSVSLAGIFALSIIAPYFELPLRVASLLMLAFPFAVGSWFYIWSDRIPLSPWIVAALLAGATLAHSTPLFWPALVLSVSYTTIWIGFARIPHLLEYNRLGDYSYGVYIYAFPLQQLMAQHGFINPVANMAVAFPLTVFCAVLSWHLVEKPALTAGHTRRDVQRVGKATV